jgi:hypothetical protein
LVAAAVVEETAMDTVVLHLKLVEAVVVLLDDLHRREQLVLQDREMQVLLHLAHLHSMEVVAAVQVQPLRLEQGV